MIKTQWRWAALKNGFKDATAYRFDFVFEVLSSALVPAIVQLVIWFALFKVGGREEVAGQSYQAMLAYTWMSTLFSQVRGGDLDFELAEMVRSGSLSNYLLRPVGVVEFVWLRGSSQKLFIAFAGLFIGLVSCFWTELSPIAMLAAMLLAVIGNIIHYQISSSLATIAFYWEEGYAVLMVKNLLVGFLSGELIPLTLFPENWAWVWRSTPFYLYVFGPTQMALGHWTWVEFSQNLMIALIWLVGAGLLVKASWGLSIRRYQSLGG